MLLGCRFALGIFESGNWPCGIRTTRAVLPPQERPLGNSIFQSGTAFGAVVTPLIVLALLRSFDPGEPQRHAIMAVTGGSYAAVSGTPGDSWKYPFRVIGSLGVIWIVLWFTTVPGALVRGAATEERAMAGSFRHVLRDRRLWLLIASVIAINITWHGYRAWLPLYLQEQRGFNEAQMSRFTTYYYLVADVGSWTVGGLTLLLCRWGIGLHSSRLITYGGCALLTTTTLLVPFLPDGWPLKVGLLLVAFGALGLFPSYFALSQEVSAKHQGKITGTLGFTAHLSLAMIYPLEGLINDLTGSYNLVLSLVGIPPLFAFAAVLWKWPGETGGQSNSD
jgi:ACS family hexuronate transporter-like MFS transporter